jgi:hypothetical protein
MQATGHAVMLQGKYLLATTASCENCESASRLVQSSTGALLFNIAMGSELAKVCAA